MNKVFHNKVTEICLEMSISKSYGCFVYLKFEQFLKYCETPYMKPLAK
jgi:hypothetical protein